MKFRDAKKLKEKDIVRVIESNEDCQILNIFILNKFVYMDIRDSIGFRTITHNDII